MSEMRNEKTTLGQEYSRLKTFHADVLGALAKYVVTPAEGYLKPTSPRASTDIHRAIREATAAAEAAAVAAEREACARVAEEYNWSATRKELAAVIRARGKGRDPKEEMQDCYQFGDTDKERGKG